MEEMVRELQQQNALNSTFYAEMRDEEVHQTEEMEVGLKEVLESLSVVAVLGLPVAVVPPEVVVVPSQVVSAVKVFVLF